MGCIIGFFSQNQYEEYTGQVNLVNFNISLIEEEPLVFVCQNFPGFSPRQSLSEIPSFMSKTFHSELIVPLPLHKQLFSVFKCNKLTCYFSPLLNLKNGIMNLEMELWAERWILWCWGIMHWDRYLLVFNRVWYFNLLSESKYLVSLYRICHEIVNPKLDFSVNIFSFVLSSHLSVWMMNGRWTLDGSNNAFRNGSDSSSQGTR